MRKKTDTEYNSKFAILYREDLKAIEDILLKDADKYNLSLSYTLEKKAKHKEEYEAEKLSEIPDNIQVKEFRIFAHYGTSYFSLSENWRHCIRISFTSPDTFLRGKFSEIEDILKNKEHPAMYQIRRVVWFAYLLFLASLVLSQPIYSASKKHSIYFITWLVFSFIATVLFIAGLITLRLKSVNVKQESSGKPLLWRKREDLFVLTIAGLISLVLYGLISILISNLP